MKRAPLAVLLTAILAVSLFPSPETATAQTEPYIPPKVEPDKPDNTTPKDPAEPAPPPETPAAPDAAPDTQTTPEPTKTPPALGVADTGAGALPKFTEELAVKAAEAFSRREWDKARAAYTEILEADPTNALALANLGAVEHQTGNFDKAQAYLEAAVHQNPRLAQSWMVLGLIYYEKEQVNLAIVLKSIGWTNGAESELLRAIELKPDYSGAHFNLSLMYLEKKPPALELARRHYETARSLGAEADPLVEERLKGK